ncbi:SLAIN motif-containing protein 1 [Oryzias melastigma]|uniref:SLAIN motif-containing protein 1 n=1 Tax=Oryzias melastigma TaxID=30732 RepID=UPI000CF820E9|nr:SLAIN motif-containing protein 1 [Oryzias melastigma]
MEAAVLTAMAEVECGGGGNMLKAELEVKKLQELVRKLERQNEQLRSRSGGCRQSSLETFHYFQPHSVDDEATEDEEEEEEEEEEQLVLDDLELLDLDSLSSEPDETWLYSSSKSTQSSSDSLTPLEWCRKVLDSPKSEVEAARKSLSLKLEQVSRWRSSLPNPSLSSSSSSSSPGPPRVAGVSPISSSPQPPDRPAPSYSSPIHPLLHRTLSPIGKELSPVAERTPTFLPHPASQGRSQRRSAFSAQSSVDSDLGASELEDDPVGLEYKLQDLTDVQVMARLQEESLRQDYASTSCVLANRRSQSFSFQLSSLGAGRGLEEDDEEDEDDYGLLPPPQPRLACLPHSHTFSSIRDWRRSTSSLCTPPSTPSTPPYLTAGFAFQAQAPPSPAQSPLGLGSLYGAEQQDFRTGSDKLRRSMPNLVRAPSMPIPTNPCASPSLLRNSQSFDSSCALARLQSSIPPPGQLQNRVQSVGNFSLLSRQPSKATAYVSPTIKGSASTSLQFLNSSGIPLLNKPAGGSASTPTTPRSSLPRPASFVCTTISAPRSKVAQPTRSLLTPPKSLSTFSALRNSSWRDGCY